MALLLAVFLPLLSGPAASGSAPAEPARLAARAFGQPAEVAVAGAGGAAQAALAAALRELEECERLADPAAGMAAIAAAAGPRPADPRQLELLARAASFCAWSEGRVGPLGGRLHRARTPEERAAALAGAACDRLALDPRQGTAAVAAGSELDLRDFAAGYGVDRAVAALKAGGAASGYVRVGAVQRGFGPGPSGNGWRAVPPPALERLDPPLAAVWLRDRALAAATTEDPLPRLDLKSGLAPEGAKAVLAVTELAADAQPLAAAMLLAGTRAGEMRLGSLRPDPSVLWLIGLGPGAPLFVEHHWSAVGRR